MPWPTVATYQPDDLAWTELANCRDVGPGPFYDWESRHPPAQHQLRDVALAYCHECDVQAECLAWALNHLDGTSDWGVWEGTTREQRVALRRRRKAT